ncbi:MAG: hypothetical protein R2827_02805 [Bdellovibrionales bacterium]
MFVGHHPRISSGKDRGTMISRMFYLLIFQGVFVPVTLFFGVLLNKKMRQGFFLRLKSQFPEGSKDSYPVLDSVALVNSNMPNLL